MDKTYISDTEKNDTECTADFTNDTEESDTDDTNYTNKETNTKERKFEKAMDKIIWFFTEPRTRIDLSDKLDDVTYEESEARLIFIGLFFKPDTQCLNWYWNNAIDLCHYEGSQRQQPPSLIWSMQRQLWLKGPYLPIKGPECIHNPTGFAINRTHGIVLTSPVYQSSHSLQYNCIEAYTFSFETFEWVQVERCLIRLMDVDYAIHSMDHSGLTCSTFQNKHGKL